MPSFPFELSAFDDGDNRIGKILRVSGRARLIEHDFQIRPNRREVKHGLDEIRPYSL